jgi:hypothetical protein
MPLKSRIDKLEKQEQKASATLDWPHDYDPPSTCNWVLETAYEKIASSADEWAVSDILEAALASGLYSGEEALMDRASEFLHEQAGHHYLYDSPLELPLEVIKDWTMDKRFYFGNHETCEDCGYLYPSIRGKQLNKSMFYESTPKYTICLLCSGKVDKDAHYRKHGYRKGSHLGAQYPYKGAS